MTFVETLEPKALWRHFDRILAIPRGSKNEAQIREHVIGIAKRAELSHQVDAAGNLLVRKPGTKGYEGCPTMVLQGHMDMVNEKNSDLEHDFSKDPIRPRQDGECLTASGTTLGADNGIGLAATLAVMESKDIVHGPLELLYTVDEETGLTGAKQLDATGITGRTLLNLDSEEEGVLYVGCAGGGESTLTLPTTRTPALPGSVAFEIKLSGMKGGHSGVDIHLQRGNAVKLLARALFAASRLSPLRLAAIRGGSAHNAIPREVFATVVVDKQNRETFRTELGREVDAFVAEYRPAEPNMKLDATEAAAPSATWDSETTATVLRLLTSLPHGVAAMSYDIPDLVETSSNLATVVPQDGSLKVGLSSRSSVASALAAARQQIRAIGELAGAAVEQGDCYPGWKPNLESPVLALVKEVHARELGAEPHIKAIHAGLECGLIGEKVKGMDMVSFGPQIEFPHSPGERVKIDTVEKFYRLLSAVLAEFARRGRP